MDDSAKHIIVLKAIQEIPFSVGKNLLTEFLIGNRKNKSIIKNELYLLENFNSFNDEEELSRLIDNLIHNNLIEVANKKNNPFLKLLKITDKGRKEISNPSLYKKKLQNNFINYQTNITKEDRIKFKELNSFLADYNDEQKKAIIEDKKKILCIAGAGSGKTTVLTKRIEFLVKYRNIDPNKILAITFTRKARQEMEDRLFKLKVQARVETFNSFCEKILRKYYQFIYKRPSSIINYGQKIMAIYSALDNIGMSMNEVTEKYFSTFQRRNKTTDQLSNIFISDCFAVLEYLKIKNMNTDNFPEVATNSQNARMIFEICKFLKNYMGLHGFRDYADQLIDTVKFFKKEKDFIPEFKHILVDEYQDVNQIQTELLALLNSENLFCVGDPRQSIFGWRGSDIYEILKFRKKYPESEIISLTKNYRSGKNLVDFMNLSFKEMNLPDIEPVSSENGRITLFDFESENKEFDFVIQKILNTGIEREEIFVLARTNKKLEELSEVMKSKGINHIIKTDEINNPVLGKKGYVTLATIHAIKGLEARMVFVIGCNEANFPCKASDHPVISMIKVNEYDEEEEEKRIFYVAISRAKEELCLSYTGKLTRFIDARTFRTEK